MWQSSSGGISVDEYEQYLDDGRPVSALVRNYVAHAANPVFGPDSDFWSFDELLELPATDPEKVWECLLCLLSRPEYRPALGLFAAGPLEDVLSWHGELLIDQVEALARQEPEFLNMLSRMYRFEMSDGIWARVRKLCDG